MTCGFPIRIWMASRMPPVIVAPSPEVLLAYPNRQAPGVVDLRDRYDVLRLVEVLKKEKEEAECEARRQEAGARAVMDEASWIISRLTDSKRADENYQDRLYTARQMAFEKFDKEWRMP